MDTGWIQDGYRMDTGSGGVARGETALHNCGRNAQDAPHPVILSEAFRHSEQSEESHRQECPRYFVWLGHPAHFACGQDARATNLWLGRLAYPPCPPY